MGCYSTAISAFGQGGKWYRPCPKKTRETKTMTKTLNDRVPPENGSHGPQTSAKRVSDDSQHFIFRLPKNFSSGFVFNDFRQFLHVFVLFWRPTHFWASLASAPWKTTPCRPNIIPVRCKKWGSALCQSLGYFFLTFLGPQPALSTLAMLWHAASAFEQACFWLLISIPKSSLLLMFARAMLSSIPDSMPKFCPP